MEKSIKPATADLGNSWMRSCGLSDKLDQDALSSEISKARTTNITFSSGDTFVLCAIINAPFMMNSVFLFHCLS